MSAGRSNVLTRDQLIRFEAQEKELEIKAQELKGYQRKIQSYEQDWQYIGDHLTAELQKRLPSEESRKLFQELGTISQNRTRGEALDLLVTTAFEVIQRREIASEQELEESQKKNKALINRITSLEEQLQVAEETATDLERELGIGQWSTIKEKSTSPSANKRWNPKKLVFWDNHQDKKGIPEAVKVIQQGAFSNSEGQNQSNQRTKSDKILKILPKSNMADAHDKIMDMVSRYVPMFSGERSPKLAKEVFRFLSCSKDVHDRLEPAEQSIFMKCIKYRLSDDAYYLISSREPKDLAALQQAIKTAYMPRKSFSELRTEMLACRQRPGEDIREFADRMVELLDQIKSAVSAKYPNMDGGLIAELEADAVTTFKAGVRSQSTQVHLIGKRFSSLEEVREEAIYFEKDAERLQAMAPGAWKKSPEYSRGTPPESWKTGNFSEIRQKQPQKHFQPIRGPVKSATNWEQPAGTTQQVKVVKCFKCGQPGHIAKNCQWGKQPPYCTRCRNYGHETSNCRIQHVRVADSIEGVRREFFSGRKGLYCQFCRTQDHYTTNCLKKYLAEKASEKFNSQSKFIITVPSDIGLEGKLTLLVDTGSTCNIIKTNRIKGNTSILTQKKIKIGGLFGSARSSIGTCVAKLHIDNSEHICEFNAIDDTDSIPADGILGMEFLHGKAIIDCVHKKLWIQSEESAQFEKITASSQEVPQNLQSYSPMNCFQSRIEEVQANTAEKITPGINDGYSEWKHTTVNVDKALQHEVKVVSTLQDPFLVPLWEKNRTPAHESIALDKLETGHFDERGRNQHIYYGHSVDKLEEGRAFVRIANARVYRGKRKNSRHEQKEPRKYSERSDWNHKGRKNFYPQRWRDQRIFQRGKFKFQEYSSKSVRAEFTHTGRKRLDRNFTRAGNSTGSFMTPYVVSAGKYQEHVTVSQEFQERPSNF